MITALWERSVSKQKVDSMGSERDRAMLFEIGGPREKGGCHYYLSENTTLLHTSGQGCDFRVYLGGNWRFDLEIDSRNGECLRLGGFMSKLTAKRAVLEVPDAEAKKLVCRSEKMVPGRACYSDSPTNSVLFDPREKILCIGDPEISGEAVEFSDRTVAVVKDGRLACVYLMLDDVGSDPENGNSLSNCIVLV